MRNPLPFIAASASNGDSPTSRRASSRHRRRPGESDEDAVLEYWARVRAGVEPAPRPGAEAAVNKRRCAHLQSHIGDVLSGEGSTSRRTRAEDGEDAEAYKTTQREAFAEQMRLATELGLPLIVHTREAETDTVAMMKEHLPADARVHVHCFTSSVGMAMELLRAFPNLCLGFTGVSTFKNGQDVRDTIKEVPLDRILLETDSPYMAPVPFRGQTCHPAMGERVAHAVAAVHEVDVEEVFARCRENTRRVYGI